MTTTLVGFARQQLPLSSCLVVLVIVTSSVSLTVPKGQWKIVSKGSFPVDRDDTAAARPAFHLPVDRGIEKRSMPVKFSVIPISDGSIGEVPGYHERATMTLDDDTATGDQSERTPLMRLTHTSTNEDEDDDGSAKLSLERRSSAVRANPTGGSLILRSMLKRDFFAHDMKRQTYCCSMDMYCFTCARRR